MLEQSGSLGGGTGKKLINESQFFLFIFKKFFNNSFPLPVIIVSG